MRVRWNLQAIRIRLQAVQEKEIQWQDIARETGINAGTLADLNRNKTRRVDFETLERLLTYFRANGLPNTTVCDLLIISDD